MNRHLEKIRTLSKRLLVDARGIARQSYLWYKEQSRPRQIGIAIIALLILIMLIRAFSSDDVSSTTTQEPRGVRTQSVASLSLMGGELSLLGTVTSTNEATIRAEANGRLVSVRKKIGDSVYASEIIAQLENRAEQAAVLQAEGSLESAKASLDIAKLNQNQAGSSAEDSKAQALNAITSAYATMDDATTGKTDVAFRDPQFDSVKFKPVVPDQSLVLTVEDKRRIVQVVLTSRSEKNRTLSTDDNLVRELTLVYNELSFFKEYLDDLALAYTKAIPNAEVSQATLDANKASLSAARQSISGVLSSTVGARTALQASLTAEGVAGSSSGTVSSGSLAQAEALVKQAEGAYSSALARYENTIVRSPLSGTVNAISIKTGDYVTMNQDVAVISNNGTLEIVAYVTSDEAKRLSVGRIIRISKDAEGIVTRIAQALDPRTKKIEVRIALQKGGETLVNGESVRILVESDMGTTTPATPAPLMYTIPISALKLTPSGSFVFTVSPADSTLVGYKVTEGAILGDMIQILSGLTGEMEIVLDARGLKEGAKVTLLQ